MRIIKLDYIIAFFIFIVLYGIQMMAPITLRHITGLFVGAIISSAIIGTITNIVRIMISFIIKSKR